MQPRRQHDSRGAQRGRDGQERCGQTALAVPSRPAVPPQDDAPVFAVAAGCSAVSARARSEVLGVVREGRIRRTSSCDLKQLP